MAIHDILFSLLRLSLGTRADEMDFSAFTNADWKELIDLSFDQGVAAIAVDGLQKSLELVPEPVEGSAESLELSLDSPELEDVKYEWFGEALSCEDDYRKQKDTIASLTRLYAQADIRTLIVKGYAASRIYPKPDHRSVGDIDIYLYGKGEEGDRLMKAQGIEIRQNEDKHSTFTFDNTPVENHATFVNVVEHPSLKELEECLEQEARAARFDESIGAYIPTAFADALFLSHHLAGHFVYGGARLKQLLDWSMLTTKYGKEIDWNRVMGIADRAGYGRLLRCLNGIVVTHLGVPEEIFPKWERDRQLECRILNEMLHPEMDKRGESVAGKVVRFFRSGWKYRLVYREPMMMTFFRRSWAWFREKYLPNSRSVWEK